MNNGQAVFVYLYDPKMTRIKKTGMLRITMFQSTTNHIYDGGPKILYYNIIILTTVLQLSTVFSTVTCCTGL